MSISSRIRFAATGAALMWFFDPNAGPARRARATAKVRGARRIADRVGLDRLGEQVKERVGERLHRHDAAGGGDDAGQPVAFDVVETDTFVAVPLPSDAALPFTERAATP